jgi:hypothetical protein
MDHTSKRKGARQQTDTPLDTGAFPSTQSCDGFGKDKLGGAVWRHDSEGGDNSNKENKMANATDNLKWR